MNVPFNFLIRVPPVFHPWLTKRLDRAARACNHIMTMEQLPCRRLHILFGNDNRVSENRSMRCGFSLSWVRAGAVAASVFFLAVVSGCREADVVSARTEPKPEFEVPYQEPPHTEKYAILGGIAPAGNGSDWYFFKLTGPANMVRERRAEFNAMINSLDFTPLAETAWNWKTPPGWYEAPGGGSFVLGRFRMNRDIYDYEPSIATVVGDAGFLAVAAKVEANYPLYFPELTITRLGGSLIDNINRWRKQLGLPPLEMSDLNRSLTLRPVKNATVFMVEMSGPIYVPPARNAAPFANPH